MRRSESYPGNIVLNIPKTYTSLEFIGSISWPEIFASWKAGEAHQKSWREHWQERGFDSWDEWRKAYASPLKPEMLQWFLYKIKDPIKALPLFYGTPTRAWIEKAYNGEKTKKFSEIINLPIIKDNIKVLDIKCDFPKKTMLTGLIYDNNIILVEGMHRGAALAGWDPQKSLDSEVTIALAEWNEELPAIGGNYKK